MNEMTSRRKAHLFIPQMSKSLAFSSCLGSCLLLSGCSQSLDLSLIIFSDLPTLFTYDEDEMGSGCR